MTKSSTVTLPLSRYKELEDKEKALDSMLLNDEKVFVVKTKEYFNGDGYPHYGSYIVFNETGVRETTLFLTKTEANQIIVNDKKYINKVLQNKKEELNELVCQRNTLGFYLAKLFGSNFWSYLKIRKIVLKNILHRAYWIYSDRDLQKEILDILKINRNKY